MNVFELKDRALRAALVELEEWKRLRMESETVGETGEVRVRYTPTMKLIDDALDPKHLIDYLNPLNARSEALPSSTPHSSGGAMPLSAFAQGSVRSLPL